MGAMFVTLCGHYYAATQRMENRDVKKIVLTVFVLCLGLGSMVNAQQMSVDERIKPYAKVSGISGNASSIGSDTMNNLMALWLEGFRKFYPMCAFKLRGKGRARRLLH